MSYCMYYINTGIYQHTKWLTAHATALVPAQCAPCADEIQEPVCEKYIAWICEWQWSPPETGGQCSKSKTVFAGIFPNSQYEEPPHSWTKCQSCHARLHLLPSCPHTTPRGLLASVRILPLLLWLQGQTGTLINRQWRSMYCEFPMQRCGLKQLQNSQEVATYGLATHLLTCRLLDVWLDIMLRRDWLWRLISYRVSTSDMNAYSGSHSQWHLLLWIHHSSPEDHVGLPVLLWNICGGLWVCLSLEKSIFRLIIGFNNNSVV